MTFYSRIEAAVKERRPFDVIERPVPLVQYLGQSPYPKDSLDEKIRICRIASLFAKQLENEARIAPREALEHEAVSSARLFLKSVKGLGNEKEIKQCQRAFLAFKLGISSSVLGKNSGFEEFASKPPLERYLAKYGHTLRVQNEQISLLQHGKYVPWDQISEGVKSEKDLWHYGPGGVQSKNFFEWTSLEPFYQSSPRGAYFLHCKSCCQKEPRCMGGDHSWVVLETPDGECISVGLYSPTNGGEKEKSPLRVQQGRLMQPDVSEFYPTPIHTISFEITEEQFKEMKRVIEEDKKNGVPFHLIGNNCTLYVEKIAKIANLLLPAEKSSWRFLFPRIETIADRVRPWTPALVQKVCAVTMAGLINTCLLWKGNHQVDPKVRDLKPHVATIGDLLNPNTLKVHHPHTLAYHMKPTIEQWRSANGPEAVPPSMKIR